jgi:hypothetical protein
MYISMVLKVSTMSDNTRRYTRQPLNVEHLFFIDIPPDIYECAVCGFKPKVHSTQACEKHFRGCLKNYDIDKKKQLLAEAKQRYGIAISQPIASHSDNSHKLSNEEQNDLKKSVLEITTLIAKSSYPISVVNLIKDCFEVIANNIVKSPDDAHKIKTLPISPNTITTRIREISADISEQLKDKLSDSEAISLSFDETNDCTDNAKLVTFIKAIGPDFSETNEFLSLQNLETNTTGEALYNKLEQTLNEFNINTKTICSVTTDGCPSMIGKRSGAVTRISNHLSLKGISINNFHCLLHQQSLCAKKSSKNKHFADIMTIVTKAVNNIRRSSLLHREFREFLKEVESEYSDVLYYCDIRWLSRGQCLMRFFKLIKLIDTFTNHETPEFSDKQWVFELAFFSDITQLLNTANLKIQGHNKLITDLFNVIKDTETQLGLIRDNLKSTSPSYANLECCQICIKENDGVIYNNKSLTDFIDSILDQYKERFSDFRKHHIYFDIFCDPFNNFNNSDISSQLKNELNSLRNDTHLKYYYNYSDISDFNRQLPKDKFPLLRENALKMNSYFGTTYQCEQFFTKMTLIKNKTTNRISDSLLEARLRISCSSIAPNFESLMNGWQYHKSN